MIIGPKKDVWHWIRRGVLMQLHLDLETLELMPKVVLIQSYGDALGDISGNLLDASELDVRVPERYIIGPEASLIVKADPQLIHSPERMDFREAIGRISERLEFSAFRLGDLGYEQESISFKHGKKKKGSLSWENCHDIIVKFPLLDDQGQVVYDVRYHPERRKVAYRYSSDHRDPYYDQHTNDFYVDDSDGSTWKFIDARLRIGGFRQVFFDIPVLQDNQCMAGYHRRNVLWANSRAALSSVQRPKNFVVDSHSTTMHVALYGPQDDNALKLAQILDPKTGRVRDSAKLDLIMSTNTRFANVLSDIAAGPFMTDGSVHQSRRAHRHPKYDSIASFSLSTHLRQVAPDIVKTLELQSDEQVLRASLNGQHSLNAPPPISCLTQMNSDGKFEAVPYVFLGFDDVLGKRGQAIFVNALPPLKDIMDLENLDTDAVRGRIEQSRRSGTPLIRLQKIRKWRGAMPLEDALRTEAAASWDIEHIDQVFGALASRPALREAIWRGVEAVNSRKTLRSNIINPLPEEEVRFHITGDLDYIAAGQDDPLRISRSMPDIMKTVYQRATDVYNYMMLNDDSLHRLALQPHPVDYKDDPEWLDNFTDLVRRVVRRLEEKGSSYGALLKRDYFKGQRKISFATVEDARDFRDNLRKRLLTDDLALRLDGQGSYARGYVDQTFYKGDKFVFSNPSRNSYHIADKHGRVIDINHVMEQHPYWINKQFEEGNFVVSFHRMSSEPSLSFLLDQFADQNRLNDVPPYYVPLVKARQARLINGPPHEDPSTQRFGVEQYIRRLRQIEVNAAMSGGAVRLERKGYGETGAAEVFAGDDHSLALMRKLKDYYEDKKAKFPESDEAKLFTHYHPETNLPLERVRYEIPEGAYTVIDIPAGHLRRPALQDIAYFPHAYIIPKIDRELKAKINACKTHVLLREEETGRLYYTGPARIETNPPETKRFERLHAQARLGWESDSGVTYPAQRSIIVTEGLYPVAGSKPYLDVTTSLNFPVPQFDQLVWPRGVHAPQKLTGLVLRKSYQPFPLTSGQRVLLREENVHYTDKLLGEDGKLTGHAYSATIDKSDVMTLGTLYTKVSAGEMTDEQAQKFGFPSAWDMFTTLNHVVTMQSTQDTMAEEFEFVYFNAVKQDDWVYFDPEKAPEASIVRAGHVTSPSAFHLMEPQPKPEPDSSPRIA